MRGLSRAAQKLTYHVVELFKALASEWVRLRGKYVEEYGWRMHAGDKVPAAALTTESP